jgi:hypothetical protein
MRRGLAVASRYMRVNALASAKILRKGAAPSWRSEGHVLQAAEAGQNCWEEKET